MPLSARYQWDKRTASSPRGEDGSGVLERAGTAEAGPGPGRAGAGAGRGASNGVLERAGAGAGPGAGRGLGTAGGRAVTVHATGRSPVTGSQLGAFGKRGQGRSPAAAAVAGAGAGPGAAVAASGYGAMHHVAGQQHRAATAAHGAGQSHEQSTASAAHGRHGRALVGPGAAARAAAMARLGGEMLPSTPPCTPAPGMIPPTMASSMWSPHGGDSGGEGGGGGGGGGDSLPGQTVRGGGGGGGGGSGGGSGDSEAAEVSLADQMQHLDLHPTGVAMGVRLQASRGVREHQVRMLGSAADVGTMTVASSYWAVGGGGGSYGGSPPPSRAGAGLQSRGGGSSAAVAGPLDMLNPAGKAGGPAEGALLVELGLPDYHFCVGQ